MMIDPQSVVQGLVQRGIPQHIAIGMAGNMAVESGFNPGINEIAPLVPGSRGGFGLNQWTGPRRVQFEQFAQGRGASLDDLDTQLDFTLWELQNTERNAFNALMQAQDPIQAAQIYSDKFLRPGIPHMDRRLAETRRLAGMPVETISTQGGGNSAGGGQGLLMDQQPKTKFQELRDKGFFDNAAMAFNSLRLRPDPNIAAVAQSRQQDRREASRGNRTAQWLRANGREDLASAVEAGLDPKAALGAALQPPERQGQIVSAEQLREMFPGTQIEDGLYSLKPDGTASKVGGSATSVTVNAGEQETAFSKETGKLLAQQAGETIMQGAAAQRSLVEIGTLETVLSRAPQGAQGQFAAIAGDLGIPVEGADDVQAARAIINRLVPQQRPPGSGPMSDADLELFKQSLPRIINQPGGNKRIIETMRAIAEYDVARAKIAQQLIGGQISQADAFAAYAELGNPLSWVRGMPGSDAPADTLTEEELRYLGSE